MCTHDLRFEQKIVKYNNFSFENYHFCSREKLQNMYNMGVLSSCLSFQAVPLLFCPVDTAGQVPG